MSASRSASLILPQPAISASVRPQPMQSPVWPLTAQTLIHGVEGFSGSISARARASAACRKPVGLVVLFFDKFALTFDADYRKSILA